MTQQQYSDDIGWVKSYEKGNKAPRTHIYNCLASSWQTAITSTLYNLQEKKIYSEKERANMDLLFLLNDSSLPNDDTYTFTGLEHFKYRSINILNYGKETSTILYTNNNAPKLLRINKGIEKLCAWVADN